MAWLPRVVESSATDQNLTGGRTNPQMTSFARLVLLFIVACTEAYAQTRDALDAPVVRTELGRSIDGYLSALESYGLSGSMLVARNGEVIVHRAYGLADRVRGVALDGDMPLLIGSLSKQFVAAAVLKLEAQGRLRVTDPLPRFFVAVPADKRSITLHQLMSHTAGMDYLPGGDLFAPADRADVMRSTLGIPLKSAPGSGFAYSNLGYTLLAGVIERVTGERHEEYIRREIFAPAGMRVTGFETDTGAWRQRLVVHSYTGSTDEGAAADFPVAPKLTGAGSVVSTVADLYRWELALAGDRILPDSSRRKLFTPHADADGPARYAYGWNVITTPRRTTLIAHAGDIGGYNADFRRYVDEGLVVIFLSNARTSVGGYRQAVMNNVSLLVAGAPYAAPPQVIKPDPKTLAAFVGHYRLPSGEELRIRLDGNRLQIGADGQAGIALLGVASAEDSASAANYDARTLAIARELVKGDLTAFQRALTPSLPFEAVRGELTRLLTAYRDSLGTAGEPEVVGTAIASPMSAKTYWRLVFERGSVLQEWAWQGGTIVGLDGGLAGAMTTTLVPTSASTAASFDPFSGRSISVELSSAKGRTLTVRSGSSAVTASRVGDS